MAAMTVDEIRRIRIEQDAIRRIRIEIRIELDNIRRILIPNQWRK